MWIQQTVMVEGQERRGHAELGQVSSLILAARDNQACSLGKELSLGLGRGRPVHFLWSNTLPRNLSLYHKHSLLDKTLKALSFWKPEVCENKKREQREPFTAAV